MVRLEPKASAEVRNYTFDWSAFLGDSDTILTSDVTADGATITNDANDATTVTFTVSGGTSGTTAEITNTITTAAGLTESETYALVISDLGEPISLAEAKAYLRVTSSDEDAKIAGMIPRARLWVEDHTGLSLYPRQFVERLSPNVYGVIRLSKGPLVSLDSVGYVDSSGNDQAYSPTAHPPSTTIFASGSWPALGANEAFQVTYTAGLSITEIDGRLLGAMFALIEGEFSEGYAYPDRSIAAARQCADYLRTIAA